MADPMHEPLSWLTLERYALGELSPEEHARVDARLSESSTDRACLEAIVGDQSELPPLPVTRRRMPWLRVSGALALAAAVLLAVLHEGGPPSRRAVRDEVKGGEVALVLRGEASGRAGTFAQGERFKLLVTCPGWLSTQLRVHVFQGGEHFAPLSSVPVFACGNGVPWPGAFKLDGREPVDVCVSFGGVGQAREPRSPRELEPSVVCQRLTPR